MLPLGGLLIAVFAGWVLNRRITDEQLGFEGFRREVWDLVIRFVAPLGVVVVFGYTIYQSFG